MRNIYLVFILLLLQFSSSSQTVIVSGECMSGSITLNSIPDVNGKPAYQGTGTVDGNAGVQVSVYWLDAPDNLWVLDFDGQPYFQNPCTFSIPPGTGATCDWTAVTGMTCTGGSPLSITGAVALPVNLISFTVNNTGNQVALDWKTATETNSKVFEVQRSSDGSNWVTIGYVNSAGNSSSERAYAFTDSKPLNGKNYYRLIQYDSDNHKLYSSVVPIDFKIPSYYIIANNPGKGIYRLTIQSSRPVQLNVSDLAEKSLIRKKVMNAATLDLNITDQPAGIYLLRLQRDNEIFTEKLIKH
jgi:hypothetical protein